MTIDRSDLLWAQITQLGVLMYTKIRYVFLTLLSITLFGCKTIKTENGKIPAQYLEHAKKYMGIYIGNFNERKGAIHLFLDGDLPKLRFIDGKKNDILGDECETRFNLLKQITVSGTEQSPNLDEVDFELNPANCSNKIIGRSITLVFSKNNAGSLELSARILEKIDSVYRCSPGSWPAGNNCHYETVSYYQYGRFLRR